MLILPRRRKGSSPLVISEYSGTYDEGLPCLWERDATQCRALRDVWNGVALGARNESSRDESRRN
jgi:hypothetical protein